MIPHDTTLPSLVAYLTFLPTLIGVAGFTVFGLVKWRGEARFLAAVPSVLTWLILQHSIHQGTLSYTAYVWIWYGALVIFGIGFVARRNRVWSRVKQTEDRDGA